MVEGCCPGRHGGSRAGNRQDTTGGLGLDGGEGSSIGYIFGVATNEAGALP